MTEDRDWWEELVRERLQHDGRVSLDDLAKNELGVPEGLLEAVEHMQQEGYVQVKEEEGERIIVSSE
ncbi:MAG: hypothetical protein SVU32_06635 [Candidatus Nanohaloarchaea archaeon]|nr:hypothetical protein [Candidatus Nanohaloarchaea archaeon]